MVWKPHVTVAAVIRDAGGRFLLVEETVDGRVVLNQPAGHLEPGESLQEAVRRETLEETGWRFEPEGVVGVYRWEKPDGEATFLRVTFHGRATGRTAGGPLDADIRRVLWLSEAEIRDSQARLRSPMVWRCVEDFLAGRHHPLNLLREV